MGGKLVVGSCYFEVVDCCVVIWCMGELGSNCIVGQGWCSDVFIGQFFEGEFLCWVGWCIDVYVVGCVELGCQILVVMFWVFVVDGGDFSCEQVEDDVVFVGCLYCIVVLQEICFGIFFVVKIKVVVQQVVGKLFEVDWYFQYFLVKFSYYLVDQVV